MNNNRCSHPVQYSPTLVVPCDTARNRHWDKKLDANSEITTRCKKIHQKRFNKSQSADEPWCISPRRLETRTRACGCMCVCVYISKPNTHSQCDLRCFSSPDVRDVWTSRSTCRPPQRSVAESPVSRSRVPRSALVVRRCRRRSSAICGECDTFFTSAGPQAHFYLRPSVEKTVNSRTNKA